MQAMQLPRYLVHSSQILENLGQNEYGQRPHPISLNGHYNNMAWMYLLFSGTFYHTLICDIIQLDYNIKVERVSD